MPNDNVNNRDILLHYRDESLQCISELYRGYDPLQYPLLFSYGTDGWHINLKLANGRKLTVMVHTTATTSWLGSQCLYCLKLKTFPVILGPLHMHERQQDAMAYFRKYGHPNLFITMTTNPNWPEIRNNLLPASDCPDLVARVFRLKLKKLLEMLTKEMIFGRPRAWLYLIEWQKCGLPHSHLLLWLIPDHSG